MMKRKKTRQEEVDSCYLHGKITRFKTSGYEDVNGHITISVLLGKERRAEMQIPYKELRRGMKFSLPVPLCDADILKHIEIHILGVRNFSKFAVSLNLDNKPI